MNDTVLLLTGIIAFGLMLIGVILTVLEFRQIGPRKRKKSGASATIAHSGLEDRD